MWQLLDKQEQHQKIKSLYEEHLLKKERILTYADCFDDNRKDADVEDVFEKSFYIKLVNESHNLTPPLKLSDININIPRITAAIKKYLKEQNPHQYNEDIDCHFKPAKHFHQNIDALWKDVSKETKDRFEAIFNKINQLLK